MDNVNHPSHYNQGNIECIDVLIDLGIAKDFCLGNALKYLWRHKQKNGLEDLKKAQWYLNKLIELETPKAEEQKIDSIEKIYHTLHDTSTRETARSDIEEIDSTTDEFCGKIIEALANQRKSLGIL